MVTNSRKRKRNKIDTDKFAAAWHEVSGMEKYVMSIWEEPTYVGPEAYNAGHIDYILGNPKNDSLSMIGTDNARYMCRRRLDKSFAKFTP